MTGIGRRVAREADRIAEWTRERLEGREERRLLAMARGEGRVCWIEGDEPEPLVTIRIATYNQGQLVAERAIATARAQTYPRLEILVIGDHCDEPTARAVESIRDPRLRFVNLPARGMYPPARLHMRKVAGSYPMNVGLPLANGAWIAPCDDDDELTPDHVEVLLQAAKSQQLEMVYSKAHHEHRPGEWRIVGSEPLRMGEISHGSVLYSAGLRFLRHSNTSWMLNEPSDWNLWKRMQRIGVRIGFLDRITYRHYLGAKYRQSDPVVAASPTDGAPPADPEPRKTETVDGMARREPAVPFFRPSLPPLGDYTDLLQQIWDSRMLSNFGTFAQRLERLAGDYLGARHVLSVVSGDIGLIVALNALELPPGSPCFISGFTFNSTINAALWSDLRPVLVDIDPETYNMDPDELAAALSKWGGPGVVLPTHVFGNPCNSDRLHELARQHDCYLVFDAAHGYGSQRADTPVGRLGDAEVFSLSGTKLVTSAEGGLIATPHDWLAERLIYLRAYGFQYDYESLVVGINGKISELHSALGLLTLSKIESEVARRAEILARYQERLGDAVEWQCVRPEDRSTYKDISIRLGHRRDAVERALADGGVQTKRYFLPLHTMKPYAPFAEGPLPQTERVSDSTLCIPAFSDLDDRTIDRIANLVRAGVSSADC